MQAKIMMRQLALIGILVSPVWGYSGGSGVVGDPYQIATFEDLMQLSHEPNDYDKHFALSGDIDLDPNLPGRRVFEQAVIASDTGSDELYFQGKTFHGTLRGNDYTIRNLTISAAAKADYLGLFGFLDLDAVVFNLKLESVRIEEGRENVGALAGCNTGSVVNCSSAGTIRGTKNVGGLIGIHAGSAYNCISAGSAGGEDNVGGLIGNSHTGCVFCCSSTAAVGGGEDLGGLVGSNNGRVFCCFSTGDVNGDSDIGGLVGVNVASVSYCYSTGAVSGRDAIGGLVGGNRGPVNNSYSIGMVIGDERSGGLVGREDEYGNAPNCFWDKEVSGVDTSIDGSGLTTEGMQQADTYLDAGWDSVGESTNGLHGFWLIENSAYPRLSFFSDALLPEPRGLGTAASPYVIAGTQDLGTVWSRPLAHYQLIMDLDLPSMTWTDAVIPWFGGTFDGSGFSIRNLDIEGEGWLGLIGWVGARTLVTQLGLEDVRVKGSVNIVGSLAAKNYGTIVNCYSTGVVTGFSHVVGGLVGYNRRIVRESYSTCMVTGFGDNVGGLVGENDYGIGHCYSSGTVKGEDNVGGLVGENEEGLILNCISTGSVTGDDRVGGLVGGHTGDVITSFWDLEASGVAQSIGGMGLATADLMNPDLLALNGLAQNAYWVLHPHQDYPRLAWEGSPGDVIPVPQFEWIDGAGTLADPFRIENADQLAFLSRASDLWGSHFALANHLELTGMTWDRAVIPVFSGTFNGNGFSIRHLQLKANQDLGLFGQLEADAVVKNLGLEAVSVAGDHFIGALAGKNQGAVVGCFVTGAVSGKHNTGGLVGLNEGLIEDSYNAASVSGSNEYIGGVAGRNTGIISKCYNIESIQGHSDAGGLVGQNAGRITHCYSTGPVSGSAGVGGLVGNNDEGSLIKCYSTGLVSSEHTVGGLVGTERGESTHCFWDVETSGQAESRGGLGLSTEDLMDPELLALNGWAQDPNWALSPYQDYPRLAWEGTGAQMIPKPRLDWITGVGTAEAPFQIADADQLVFVRKIPALWSSHFELVTDLDLTGLTWDKPVIPTFSGYFNGNGFCILGLKIRGSGYLGLIGQLAEGAVVTNLGLEHVDIEGFGGVGSLAGTSQGSILNCFSTGRVSGNSTGGLVGRNEGRVISSYSAAAVTGSYSVGGLIGTNAGGMVLSCYSSGSVVGESYVGGLVGSNDDGKVAKSFSTGRVTGKGGLDVGGFVGSDLDSAGISNCFWDMESTGIQSSAGGIGLSTAEMMDPEILGLNGLANDPNWVLESYADYPRLAWQGSAGSTMIPDPLIDWMEGNGAAETPFQVNQAEQLVLVSKASALWQSHFELVDDVDLAGLTWNGAPIQRFSGRFDGNGFSIRHLKIEGEDELGLFGQLTAESVISDLGLDAVNIHGGNFVGSLAGKSLGHVLGCHSTGSVTGEYRVGGLLGGHGEGQIAHCYSGCTVTGVADVGGLIGRMDSGTVSRCYTSGSIEGNLDLGGLIGSMYNAGISNSYSESPVTGRWVIGGLIGVCRDSSLRYCYSIGPVRGDADVGGLVGKNDNDDSDNANVAHCFWDKQSSGKSSSEGGTGLMTANMQIIDPFLSAGWDFADEEENGLEDIWRMSPETGYPVFSGLDDDALLSLTGLGTPESPYLISSARDLEATVNYSASAYYQLVKDIDLSNSSWTRAIFPSFSGCLDGNYHVIRNLRLKGEDKLGVIGQLNPGAKVCNLGVVDAYVSGTNHVGTLVGRNQGLVQCCYSSGTVLGYSHVGGLVGENYLAKVSQSYSRSFVSGHAVVGGLVGRNGKNSEIAFSYSAGMLSGNENIGGLVGVSQESEVTQCFWDIYAAGVDISDGGVGLPTIDMQTINTYLNAGWDFVGEAQNGTEDIWFMPVRDYPELAMF